MSEYKNETTDGVDLAAEVAALATGKHSIQCKRYGLQLRPGGTRPTNASDGVFIARNAAGNAEDTAIWARGDRGIHIGYIEV